MTLEQHLKQIVGDLILTVARLQAEIDDLRAQADKTKEQVTDHADPSRIERDNA